MVATDTARNRTLATRPNGSARAIATYLVEVRPLLAEITESRRAFIRHIGVLMEDARHAGRGVVVQAAGRIGRDEGQAFRGLRAQLDRLPPPAPCDGCHQAVVKWTDLHVAACQVMVEVGVSGDLTRLRETQSLLADARTHAQQFNTEYTRLVADVRQRVRAAATRQRRAVR